MPRKGQVIIFWNGHQNISRKIPILDEDNILDNLNETELKRWCNVYIYKDPVIPLQTIPKNVLYHKLRISS